MRYFETIAIYRMSKKNLKTHTLAELKDKHLGKIGTPERDTYEYELRMEILGRMIRATRRERKLTQEELGRLVGVQKAQISKLESSATNATVDTIVRIFSAMNAEINFTIKLEDNYLKLT